MDLIPAQDVTAMEAIVAPDNEGQTALELLLSGFPEALAEARKEEAPPAGETLSYPLVMLGKEATRFQSFAAHQQQCQVLVGFPQHYVIKL